MVALLLLDVVIIDGGFGVPLWMLLFNCGVVGILKGR